MNKEVAVQKINKIGKIAGILANIAKVFTCIGFAGCIIGIIAMCIIPKGLVTYRMDGIFHAYVDLKTVTDEDFNAELKKEVEDSLNKKNDISVEVNGVEYENAEYTVTDNGVIEFKADANTIKSDIKTSVIPLIIMGAVVCALSFVSLIFLRRLCRNFETCSTPFSDEIIRGLKDFAYSLIPWVLIRTLTNSLTSSFFIGDLNINWSIDLSMVIVVLVILALAYIFSYGAVLQQESDETL